MTSPHSHPRHGLRIPFRLQMLYSSRRFYTGFGIVMAAFCLYGPIPARMADHNALRYLLGPFVCSLLAACIHLLFPYNPYGSRFQSDRSLYRLDERDEGARRFLELLRSDGCRRVAVVTAVNAAVLLFAIMAGFAFWFRASLNWTLRSPWDFQGLGGGTLFAWILIRVRAVSWALTTWREEAESSHAA